MPGIIQHARYTFASFGGLSLHMTEQFQYQRGNLGWIEVICGSMFSGKSEELIRRMRRAQIARQRVQIFKPKIDTRYSEDHIVSHSEMKIKSQLVTTASEIIEQ